MQKRKSLIAAAIVLVALGAGALALPSILRLAGLHPHYAGRSYNLAGKRALVIATNHGILGDTGKPTGVYASEMTVPYYEFLDAGMTVDVASVAGGVIPVEPMSMRWPLATPSDRRFMADRDFKAKVAASVGIDSLEVGSYDLVYLAGGWGASWGIALNARKSWHV
jgi:putative intracellular protease/amidase